MELLIFEIAGQRFGVVAHEVERVYRSAALTRLPGAPDAVEGVLDIRGVLTPVFDLRRRFGLPPSAVELSQHLVTVRAGERLVAFRADQALAVSRVSEEQLVDSPATAAAPHVAGVARLEDGLVVIHDLSRFLDAAEQADLDQSLAAATGSV